MDYREYNGLNWEDLVKAGYRRVSNKHRLIARIDREDWLTLMAQALKKAPADFYVPGAEKPAGNWCDWYRRCMSRDVLKIDASIIKQVPPSDWDNVGYVELIDGDPKIATDGKIRDTGGDVGQSSGAMHNWQEHRKADG
jgi:hypothetical protein